MGSEAQLELALVAEPRGVPTAEEARLATLSWPSLSDGRTGEGVFGSFLMVLVDFGSFWSFSNDLCRFPMVFARFRPVRGTGEWASQPPQSTSQLDYVAQ